MRQRRRRPLLGFEGRESLSLFLDEAKELVNVRSEPSLYEEEVVDNGDRELQGDGVDRHEEGHAATREPVESSLQADYGKVKVGSGGGDEAFVGAPDDDEADRLKSDVHACVDGSEDAAWAWTLVGRRVGREVAHRVAHLERGDGLDLDRDERNGELDAEVALGEEKVEERRRQSLILLPNDDSGCLDLLETLAKLREKRVVDGEVLGSPGLEELVQPEGVSRDREANGIGCGDDLVRSRN